MGTPQIVLGICEFVVLLFALSLHESAHGWMASRLGDQTARMLGRITLNPLKHIDPVATIMLPLVAPSGATEMILIGLFFDGYVPPGKRVPGIAPLDLG